MTQKALYINKRVNVAYAIPYRRETDGIIGLVYLTTGFKYFTIIHNKT